MSEGELIYPPGSKFKVLGIREVDPAKELMPASLSKLSKAKKEQAVEFANQLKNNWGATEGKWETYKAKLSKDLDGQVLDSASKKMFKGLLGLSFQELKNLEKVKKSGGKKYIVDLEE